jgi:hypothetical protein
MNITEKFNVNVMEHLRTIPDINMNFRLIDTSIIDMHTYVYADYHYLQQKGILYLLKKLRDGNLKYVPTDVLRNHLGNLNLYLDLLSQFKYKEIENTGDINLIFQNTYYQTLVSLNYLIDMKAV